jgi:hypothetical protein
MYYFLRFVGRVGVSIGAGGFYGLLAALIAKKIFLMSANLSLLLVFAPVSLGAFIWAYRKLPKLLKWEK